jgi:hypothetical protein
MLHDHSKNKRGAEQGAFTLSGGEATTTIQLPCARIIEIRFEGTLSPASARCARRTPSQEKRRATNNGVTAAISVLLHVVKKPPHRR